MKNNEVIEKMASDMNYACVKHDLWPDDAKEIAKALVILGYTKNKIPEGSVVLSTEEYAEYVELRNSEVGELVKENRELGKQCLDWMKLYHKQLTKTNEARKGTAREILSLAIKHDNGYETDMTRFISALKKQYGVEE